MGTVALPLGMGMGTVALPAAPRDRVLVRMTSRVLARLAFSSTPMGLI